MTLDGGYGRLRKKYILQTDFEGKKILQGNISVAKKISFMSYNAGKKTYTAVCQEKEFFHQRVEKKKLVHKPNHPNPPSKDK